jgi:hypothetical protein
MIVSDILGIFQAFTPSSSRNSQPGAEMLKVFEATLKTRTGASWLRSTPCMIG